MTTDQHRAAILARIGDCDYVIAQAAAQGRIERGEVLTWKEAALELAATKALAGLWRESRDAAARGRE
jgi:hypothetical protein